MNLVKELHKTARKNYEKQLREAEQVLDSVKANLEMDDGNDRDMLRYFGTSSIVHDPKQTIKKVNRFIEGEYVTTADVKNVCIKYHLRCLNSEYYKKEIPLAVLNDLRLFKENNKLSDCDLSRNLLVIAPASHFALGKRPAKDPVLIYQSIDHYKIISKWGNDFTFLRRFYRLLSSPFIINGAVLFLSVFLCSITMPKADSKNGNFYDFLSVMIIAATVVTGLAQLFLDKWFRIIKKNDWDSVYFD